VRPAVVLSARTFWQCAVEVKCLFVVYASCIRTPYLDTQIPSGPGCNASPRRRRSFTRQPTTAPDGPMLSSANGPDFCLSSGACISMRRSRTGNDVKLGLGYILYVITVVRQSRWGPIVSSPLHQMCVRVYMNRLDEPCVLGSNLGRCR
jgi:hypothetical protein